MGILESSSMAGSIADSIDANLLFLVQCVVAAVIGGLEFCFPALFVDTFNTFEVYTSHRLYGATMIVNAIVVFAMRDTTDPKLKREIVQAFLFQFGLHIIVLLRPQVWGFLTSFNKVNLLCSFALAATYGYLLMGDSRKISTQFNLQKKVEVKEAEIDKLKQSIRDREKTIKDQQTTIARLEGQVKDARRKQ